MKSRFYDVLDVKVDRDCDHGWCVGILGSHDENDGGTVYIYCHSEHEANMLATRITQGGKKLIQTVEDTASANSRRES